MRLTWNDLTVSPYDVDFAALLADLPEGTPIREFTIRESEDEER